MGVHGNIKPCLEITLGILYLLFLTFYISNSNTNHIWKETFKHLSLQQTGTPNECQTQESVWTLNWVNVAFIIAQCTNGYLKLIPLRFLETILSHVDSIWSHLPWKTGQNLLFITRYNCQAGYAAEVGDIVEIPIVRRKCTFAWFVLPRDLGSSFLMWHFSFLFLSIITMYSGKIHRHEYTPQTQSARLYSVVKQYIDLYIKKGDIVFQQ